MKGRRKMSGSQARLAKTAKPAEAESVRGTDLGRPLSRAIGTAHPGFRPAPHQIKPPDVSMPTPEWLAEMALRILLVGKKDPLEDFVAMEANEQRMEAGIWAAYCLYLKADTLLARRTTERMPVLSFFTPEEVHTERIPHERGCKLITGETKPKRALEKWLRFVESTNRRRVKYGDRPIRFPKRDETFTPTKIVLWMGDYEKFSKKPLDLTKSQYAPHPEHVRHASGQVTKKRGQSSAGRGQK